MRYLGLLLTLAIICVLVYLTFRALGFTPNNQKDAEWYYAHPTERAQQLKWCSENAQQQDSSECTAAVAAQTRVDTEQNQ